MNAPVALGSSLYLGLLSVGATIPTFQAPAAAPLINTGVRRRSIVVAQNSMPLTIPVSSLAGSITNVAITVT